MPENQSDSPRYLSKAEQPRCPKCHGVPRLLSKIEAGPPGYDYRTFECRNCGRVHKMIVSGDLPESDVDGWLLGEVMPPNSFTR